MKKIIFFSPLLFLVCGCSPENKSSMTHEVQWYLDNPKEHRAQLDICRSNPAKFESTPNCINAKEAAGKKAMGYGKFNPN